jgi:hypothetical protein
MSTPRYEIKRVTRDDREIWKFKCPGCGHWGVVDDDQLHGRVSIVCLECTFHETVDLATLCSNGAS